jgi:ATP-dependent DNA helicase PIF1
MNGEIELSIEQQCALQQFEEGQNLFITGPAGTGKSTIVKEFIKSAVRRNKNMQICAMTGCAAILLGKGARTIHSWSGIKIDNGTASEILHRVLKNDKNFAPWETTDILYIDEVSMMSQKMFDILDDIGKSTRNCDKPFGGLQVLFSGDFYQLPPIGKATEPSSGNFCFESPRWNTIFTLDNHIILSTIFRQTNPEFQQVLGGVRTGNLTKEHIQILKSRLTVEYNQEENHGCSLTRLVPTRKQADHINETTFAKIQEQCYEFKLLEKADCTSYMETGQPLTKDELLKCSKMTGKMKIEEFKMLKANAPCIETLQLKKGSTVMCLVNFSMEEGICNGSIGTIKGFNINCHFPVPIVQFSNGIVKEIKQKYWQSQDYPAIGVAQIPLCLAWAITIHKSQGSTLPMAQIDIGGSIFECGQSYVGLSRVQSLEGVYLSGFNPSKIRVNEKVKKFYDSIPPVEYEYESEEEKETNEVDDTVKKIDLYDYTAYACC